MRIIRASKANHRKGLSTAMHSIPLPKFSLPILVTDYVLFKLDIDSGHVEKGTVDHLLSDDNDDLEYIDEFFWEQHVRNYIMAPAWKDTIDKSLGIADSYQYFLRLRQKGVRAHSWI